MKWISIEDRLPDEEGYYLVFPHKYGIEAEFHLYGKFEGKFTSDDENGYEYERYISHWMDIPADPVD